VRILDYQKPNPTAYGQKRKKSFFDRFGGSMVGSALMPQGMSREDMPLQAPPRIPDIQMPQGDMPKLAGMFLSAPPIPDRIGDVYRDRRAQKEAMLRHMRNPGNYGQDGGMSPWDAEDQGSYIPRNSRPGVGGNRSGWRQGAKYPDRAGLDSGISDQDYQDASRPRARLSRVMGPGNEAPTKRKKRQRVSDSWLG
jgi:hypothetical protein